MLLQNLSTRVESGSRSENIVDEKKSPAADLGFGAQLKGTLDIQSALSARQARLNLSGPSAQEPARFHCKRSQPAEMGCNL